MLRPVVVAEAPCKPNISDAGVRRRRAVARGGLVVAGVVLGAALLGPWAWWTAGLVLPFASLAGVSHLQATRRTCVAHAVAGTVEDDAFRATPGADDDVRKSRAMAATVLRDGVAFGALVTSAALGLAFLVRGP